MSEYIKDHMRESLKGHQLDGLTMKRPGTGMYSVYFAEFGGRMAITGDLQIRKNGVISDLGYDLEWFRHATEEYLCQKFLEQRWTQERAEKDIKNALETEPERFENQDVILLKEFLNYGSNYTDYIDMWRQLSDPAGMGFGEGFDVGEAGWLCAVQERYAQLRIEQETLVSQ